MARNALSAVAAVASLIFVVACGGGTPGTTPPSPVPPPTYSYAVPDDIGDGWVVADLADEGIDAQKITDMMNRILDGTYPGIDSVAIVRNHSLLLYWLGNRSFDQYDDWIGNRDTERHSLHSTSKSFTSALIGIAIDKGFIASIQVGFYGLFNYAGYGNWDSRKADMTLEDALTMRLGLTWNEWSRPYTDPRNELVSLESNYTDWPKALLDLPMSSDPGTVFAYNTAATIAIGQALENATGMPMADFANTYLFYPMQIIDAEWWKTPTGLPNGGSGLFLRTRDLIKFGQLYLDNGMWQGQQLISADWVADSVVRHVDVSAQVTYSEGYGYQWWLDDFPYRGQTIESWTTSGFGGQYIFIVPALDLVVAFTGHNYDNDQGIQYLYTMMRTYILPAVD